jgi:hypothetical protein
VPLDRMLLLFRDDRRVQGRTHDQRDLLDVESVAGHLLKLVDEGKDTPRWQIAQRAAPDRVISVTDPEGATFRGDKAEPQLRAKSAALPRSKTANALPVSDESPLCCARAASRCRPNSKR